MKFACWFNKATDTHLDYAILISFPLQHLLRKSSYGTLFVLCLPCLVIW